MFAGKIIGITVDISRVCRREKQDSNVKEINSLVPVTFLPSSIMQGQQFPFGAFCLQCLLLWFCPVETIYQCDKIILSQDINLQVRQMIFVVWVSIVAKSFYCSEMALDATIVGRFMHYIVFRAILILLDCQQCCFQKGKILFRSNVALIEWRGNF